MIPNALLIAGFLPTGTDVCNAIGRTPGDFVTIDEEPRSRASCSTVQCYSKLGNASRLPVRRERRPVG